MGNRDLLMGLHGAVVQEAISDEACLHVGDAGHPFPQLIDAMLDCHHAPL